MGGAVSVTSPHDGSLSRMMNNSPESETRGTGRSETRPHHSKARSPHRVDASPTNPPGSVGACFFFIPVMTAFTRSTLLLLCLLGQTASAAATVAQEHLAAIPVPTGVAGDAGSATALEEAVEKAKLCPERAERWIAVGEALAQLQRDQPRVNWTDHAQISYEQALRLQPQSVQALNGLAWVFGQRHEFPKSIECAERALTFDPQSPEALGILGDAALELGRYDEALDHYQKMMDVRPDLSSWSRGAYALWVTGDKGKALWLMERALKAGAPFSENTDWCRAKLATMLFHDGAMLPAEQLLQPRVQAGCTHPQILLIAGRVAVAQAKFTEATGYFQSMLTSGPQHDALVALGEIQQHKGHLEAAEALYLQVEALHAQNVAAGVHDHTAMARFYADHERQLPDALRLAEEHQTTRNVLEADVLAWVYHKAGEPKKAISSMKLALSQHTPDAELHFHAGMIAAKAGDATAGRKHLQTALSMNPRFSLLLSPVAQQMLDTLSAGPLAATK
jgi:tetratricopeptide (TPR) repeat protein